MSVPSSTLHILCGKVAAGKSTLAAKLAAQPATILISEDDWLNALYADQMSSISDYVRCSAKLRTLMGPHIASVLDCGTSVVLDFPANTVEARNWMRGILQDSGAAHQLHLLDTQDDVCLARLRQRNASGDHPFTVTEEQFRQISKHFVAPMPDEGFEIVRHDAARS